MLTKKKTNGSRSVLIMMSVYSVFNTTVPVDCDISV